MNDPTIEQLYGHITHLHKSMRFQILCDDENINFVDQKGRKESRIIFVEMYAILIIRYDCIHSIIIIIFSNF